MTSKKPKKSAVKKKPVAKKVKKSHVPYSRYGLRTGDIVYHHRKGYYTVVGWEEEGELVWLKNSAGLKLLCTSHRVADWPRKCELSEQDQIDIRSTRLQEILLNRHWNCN